MKYLLTIVIILFYEFSFAQNWQTIEVPFYGVVEDFAVSESNSLIIYAASGSDGVYKTIDAGKNWQRVSAENISLIAVSKIDPNYVMTNKSRSSDGGLTWMPLSSPFLGFKLEFAANSNNIIYYENGPVFRSTNFGESWNQLSPPSNDFLLHPSSSSLIYIVGNTELYKSSDYGNTWYDTTRFSYATKTSSACIDMNNANNLWIIHSDTIFITTDGGNSFQKHFFGIGGKIIHDKMNSSNLYLYGIYDEVYKSTDFGLNWDRFYSHIGTIKQIKVTSDGEIYLCQNSSGYSGGLLKINRLNDFMVPVGVKKTTGSRLYIGDNNNILLESTAHLYKTTNQGINWFLILSYINNVASFGLDNSTIYAPHSDILKSTNGGKNWDEIVSPISYSDGIRVSDSNGNAMFLWNNDNIVRTTNAGLSWSTLNIPAALGTFGTVSKVSNIDQNTLYYTSDLSYNANKLFRSSDLGTSWNEIIINWENGEEPVSIVYGSPPSNTYLTAKSVYKSDDNGNSWSRIYNYLSPPYLGYIGNLHIDPNNENRMFANYSISPSLIGSSDAGYTWHKADSDIPTSVTRIYDMGISTSGDLYLLTDIGIIYGNPTLTNIENEAMEIPNYFSLDQNFPNPFNCASLIKYSIPKSTQVSLKIFNTLGEEIETLVNEEKSVGYYEINWNAANLPSGVYFYRILAGEFVETKKMLLLK